MSVHQEQEPITYPEANPDYRVSPVHLALVHLTKPIDLAAVAQIAIATGHVKIDRIGETLPLSHPKVRSKVLSWNIDPVGMENIESNTTLSVSDLRTLNPGARLIGTLAEGGENPFHFDWEDTDIIVIGGANGLSRADIDQLDRNVTIPTTPETSFLTVSTVVSALAYHILTHRELWKHDIESKKTQK